MPRLAADINREMILFDLGRLILDGASFGDDELRAALDLIAAGLQLEYVELFEFLQSDDAVRLIGSNGPDRAAVGAVEQLDPDSLLADARLRAGPPVLISDWQGETRLKLPAAMRDAGVTTSVAIVISVGGGKGVYGFLTAHSREPRTFSDDEVLFLETVESFLACAFAVARSARLFRALVENALDLIVRFDRDLRVIYANPAIEHVTATAAELLIGKTSSDLGILEPMVPTWELLMRQVWRTGREQSYELTVATPAGERVFDSRIVPETGPDGAVQSLLTISRDVTAQRRAEADRLVLYQQLETQQNHVYELIGRLEKDHERALGRVASTSQLRRVSDRERRILRLLAAGWTNRQIGAEIGLSTGTVKNHVASILANLGVNDRTQAAVRAVWLGLLEDPEHEREGRPVTDRA